jgi:hypothetical protein
LQINDRKFKNGLVFFSVFIYNVNGYDDQPQMHGCSTAVRIIESGGDHIEKKKYYGGSLGCPTVVCMCALVCRSAV